LRNHNEALRRGSLEFLTADEPAEFLAFRRSTPAQTMLVGLNRGASDYGWEVPLAAGESVRQVFTASGEVEKAHIQRRADRDVVTVPACDGVVLELRTGE
jgi:hypothetical protein